MWNNRYNTPEFAYGKAPNDFLKENVNKLPPGKVLCLAEGEGRNAVFLAQHGYTVTAVDLSDVGLQKAEKLAGDSGVQIETVVADLADFDLGVGQWDGIVSISAHMPADIRKSLHKRVEKGLKSGGVFLLEAYTDRQPAMQGEGGPPASAPDFFMSLESLEQELSGLLPQVGQEVERMIAEGIYHQGLSSVVQFIAERP